MTYITNQTLESLLVSTGSVGIQTAFGNYSFQDQIFERYYNSDYNSSELNIDFTNYANFVFYGSAENRLNAFKQKLIKIERLQNQLQDIYFVTTGSFTAGAVTVGPITSINEYSTTLIISSSAFIATGSSDTAYYIQEKTKELSLDVEQIIRSMDQYEQYLFFDVSNAPYSASYMYVDGGIEYNSLAAWPKNSINQPFSVFTQSGSQWFDQQVLIAQRWDEFNQNTLLYHIPLHILEDTDSTDFLTFITMIGNMFDNIKPYIDQFPNIFDRNPDPTSGLSGELVYQVAESLGVKFPNILAIRNIEEFIIGSQNKEAVRVATAEVWKRLLHNLIFILKSKGTKAAIETVFRSLGFHPQLISIKETGFTDAAAFQIVDEFTNSLQFNSALKNIIEIPQHTVVASGSQANTLQFRFSTQNSLPTMSLFTGDNLWEAELVAHPSYSGLYRIELKDFSLTPLVTSSYTTFGDGEFYDVMVRKLPTSIDLTVIKNIAGDILYSSSNQGTTAALLNQWNLTNVINLGGTGSLVVNSFDGYIDEVRLWGDTVGDAEFVAQTNDPGSFVGNTYSSSVENLYFQLSFLKEYNLSLGWIPNESPYQSASVELPSASLVGFVSTSAYTRLERQISYNIPTLGASSYVSNQIKVKDFNISSSMVNNIPTLRPNKSYTLLAETGSGQTLRQTMIGIAPTDFINERISRTFGSINVTDAIGDPANLFGETYTKLEELQQYYANKFSSYIDTNKLITIFELLIVNLKDFIESLTPAHTNLLFGILIEQNLLERRKITFYNGISVDGTGTRNTAAAETGSFVRDTSIHTLDKIIDIHSDILQISSDDIMDSFKQYTTYDMKITGSVVPTDSEYVTYDGVVIEQPTTGDGEFELYEVTIGAETPTLPPVEFDYYEAAKITGSAEIVISDYTTYDSLIAAGPTTPDFSHPTFVNDTIDLDVFPTLDIALNAETYTSTQQDGLPFRIPAGLIPDVKYYYSIPPITDLTDIGVTTYFNSPYGIYAFPTTVSASVPSYILNFTSQSWVRGTRYSPNDVVVQADITGSSANGNGRFYRYMVNPATTVCTSQLMAANLCSASVEQLTSGTVSFALKAASYTIPYQDTNSWQVVKFTREYSTELKRVVFDQPGQSLLDVTYSKLNIISLNVILSTNNRNFVTFSPVSLGGSASVSGIYNIQNIFSIIAYKSSANNIRLRLFKTADDQLAQTNALFDTTITTLDTYVTIANPVVVYNGDNPVLARVYYTIDNLDASNKSVDIDFIYFSIDAIPLVPIGYLPRHYKFYRDTSSGTLRRNYLGCLQTQFTTIDGGSPVEITLSPTSDLVISPNANQTDLAVGGGGSLNVT